MSDAIDQYTADLMAALHRSHAANTLVTETAADLFHGWLLSQGWTEPPVDPEGCGMCEFRAAMVRALQDGQ